MLLYPRSRNRPCHYGPYPLEALAHRAIDAADLQRPGPRLPQAADDEASILYRIAEHYRRIFAGFGTGEFAPERAPVPKDLSRRSADIKGFAYFMDAAHVGICELPDVETRAELRWAIAILVEYGREPERDNLASHWVRPAVDAVARMRAEEIAAVLAGHIRAMGWPAEFDVPGPDDDEAGRVCVLAGVGVERHGRLSSPFIGERFAAAIVRTAYPLACDLPLAEHVGNAATGVRYWWGINGARSGREVRRRLKRATHLSNYPMETVKTVDRPTTLILDDEVPRVPKRAAFFERALQGDLGAKARRERSNFSFKHPTSRSLVQTIRALVPHQDGPVADVETDAYANPEANSRAIKSLAYFLGADLAGICEIPRYAWFSHKEDGTPIEMYHKYAVVMLIDQGFDTMEGASGDDWISGTQSMRGYLRGAEIAGVMAAQLRALGFSARSQTNADSDVLHIPLILWAGLGELSRIGELVLNPFVGPRFKSVVLTTNMPLASDKPIDFGLQTFCRNCLKCARECPCDAISWGESVIFNGYEMWKLDVERCTRYRLTNSRGAACGRCMKTCPINKVVDADGALLTRLASWLGIHARLLKPLLVPIATRVDDKLGNGRRNPVKKWWFDHEIVGGVTVAPGASNEREIDVGRRIDPKRQPIAYYNADAMPAPDAPAAVPLDRKAALRAARLIETPRQALERRARGEPRPTHYVPTPAVGGGRESAKQTERARNPYEQ
jgi:reductive dehalogenase